MLNRRTFLSSLSAAAAFVGLGRAKARAEPVAPPDDGFEAAWFNAEEVVFREPRTILWTDDGWRRDGLPVVPRGGDRVIVLSRNQIEVPAVVTFSEVVCPMGFVYFKSDSPRVFAVTSTRVLG